MHVSLHFLSSLYRCAPVSENHGAKQPKVSIGSCGLTSTGHFYLAGRTVSATSVLTGNCFLKFIASQTYPTGGHFRLLTLGIRESILTISFGGLPSFLCYFYVSFPDGQGEDQGHDYDSSP